jgi:hypothetical protein
MKQRPVIALDYDDTCVPTRRDLLRHYDGLDGTDFHLDDTVGYSLVEVWKCSEDEAWERVFAHQAMDHSHVEPLPGSREILKILSPYYDFQIVTARPSYLEYNTLPYIKLFFGEDISALHMAENLLNGEFESVKSKLEVCRDIGAVVLIDDHPHHVQLASEEGLPCIVHGMHPWNHDIQAVPGLIFRAPTWSWVPLGLHILLNRLKC